MRNLYDKLLLLAAILVLALGSYFYMSTVKRAPIGWSPAPKSAAYTPRHSDMKEPSIVNWSVPEEQSTGWTYDVFTPPKIYLDENGQFVSEGWKIYESVPFGVVLSKIEKIPYRIQLEGYIEEDPSDPHKSLLLLYNEETGRSIRTRVGRRESAAEIDVIEFKIDRLRDAYGNPYKEVYAILRDRRTGQMVSLNNDERLYMKAFTVELRSESDPERIIQLSKVGEAFTTADGKYRLESVDFQESRATIYKYASDKRDAETLSLKLQPAAPSGADEDSSGEGKVQEASASLDALFN